MAAEAQMSKADAKKALDAFISSVTNAMKAGDKVALVGFGTVSYTHLDVYKRQTTACVIVTVDESSQCDVLCQQWLQCFV